MFVASYFRTIRQINDKEIKDKIESKGVKVVLRPIMSEIDKRKLFFFGKTMHYG